MKVELKVDGVAVGEKVVKNVNFRNGADVNAGLSAGASQIGQAIMDIGSQNKLSEAGAANAGALARMVNPLGERSVLWMTNGRNTWFPWEICLL